MITRFAHLPRLERWTGVHAAGGVRFRSGRHWPRLTLETVQFHGARSTWRSSNHAETCPCGPVHIVGGIAVEQLHRSDAAQVIASCGGNGERHLVGEIESTAEVGGVLSVLGIEAGSRGSDPPRNSSRLLNPSPSGSAKASLISGFRPWAISQPSGMPSPSLSANSGLVP